eukprot:1111580-Rhodomonas_salina.2
MPLVSIDGRYAFGINLAPSRSNRPTWRLCRNLCRRNQGTGANCHKLDWECGFVRNHVQSNTAQSNAFDCAPGIVWLQYESRGSLASGCSRLVAPYATSVPDIAQQARRL